MQINERWADQILSGIMQKIVDGELRPGDVLNEVPLAGEFGVSRTPVREALQRLSVAGLAERGPRRAFVVRKMDIAAMQYLFETVGEMEALVARIAAQRMTEPERRTLADIVEAGEEPAVDYALANAQFHDAIQTGAHNPVLAGTLADLNLRTLPWRRAQFRSSTSRIQSSRLEHRAIMEAILAHDGEAAARLMRSHMAASFMGIAANIS